MAKNESKEKRIDDLIAAAVLEFLEKGYEGASVEAIARRAGVSKGGFYHHFPNKEILLMEANRRLSEPINLMCQAALDNPSPVEGLRTYARSYLAYWKDHQKELSFFFLSMSKAMDSELLRDYYRESVSASTGFYTELFRRAAAAGELAMDDPETYGALLMGALDGAISYLIVNERESVDSLMDKVERIWIAPFTEGGRHGG
jgi:AcrR family transcriptional regulator